jgi:hypothetical protein
MSISEQKVKFKIFGQLPLIIVLIGLALSIIQLFFNRSLWNDEASLALNIIHKSHLELLKPLDYLQVAPILFLQFEKVLATLIPNSEIGLRLFPFISYCISLILFYKIVLNLFKNKFSIILALSLFVFSATLLIYSNQIKQYICDVMVVNLIFYLCLKEFSRIEMKFIFLSIAGIVALFISNVSIFILFSAGLYLLIEYVLIEKKYFKPVFATSFLWIIGFSTYYFLFIHGHQSLKLEQEYFTKLNGFLPQNFLSAEFYI